MLWLFFEAGESHKLSLGIAYTNTVHRLLGHIDAEYVWVCGYMNFLSHALAATPTFLPPTPHHRVCWHYARSGCSAGLLSTCSRALRQRHIEHRQIVHQNAILHLHNWHVVSAEDREEVGEADSECAMALAFEDNTRR